jgi:hypothetical protein
MYGMWGKCDGGDAGTRLDVVSIRRRGIRIYPKLRRHPMKEVYTHLLPLHTPQPK